MAPKCLKVSENDVVLLMIAQDCSGLLGIRGFGYVCLRLVTPGYLTEDTKREKWQKDDWQKDEKGTGTTDLTADITQMNADEGTPICVHLCSSAVDQFVQGLGIGG